VSDVSFVEPATTLARVECEAPNSSVSIRLPRQRRRNVMSQSKYIHSSESLLKIQSIVSGVPVRSRQ
jgi:hypothetical protein